MPSYRYRAQDADGLEIAGVIEADDRAGAIAKIKAIYPVITDISEVPFLSRDIEFGNKGTSDKQLAMLCKQFSGILQAGLPLVRVVGLVATQTENKYMKKALGQIAGDLSAGVPLSTAFRDRVPHLPAIFMETIRAGEESGNLAKAFERLASYFTKSAKVKQKVKSALTYPAFIVVVAVLVIIVVMVFAVPTFSKTFASMNMELPLLTRIVIGVSDFLGKNILYILLVAAILIFAIKVYSKTDKGELKFSKMKLSLPLIGKITQMSNAGQYARNMQTMLSTGLTVISSMTISAKSTTNRCMRDAALRAVTMVESGRRIGDSLKKEESIPNLLTEMVAMGEEAGTLEKTLTVVADYYDEEVDNRTTKALSILEPAIIVVLAVFVIIILLAIYIPMFSMYNGF